MQDLLEKLPKIKIVPETKRELPQTPGIYIFFNDLVPIYIGKAVNLKRRISSYFDLELEPKTARMINEANYLSYIKVTSELESLLLEARLIRKYMPRYNVVAKDDKHPLYIRITKEKYPRIITARKIEETEKNLAFYGPFPSSRSIYTTLRILRRIFPYSDHKLGNRPCLYSHIGLCNPCPSEISNTKDQKVKMELQKQYKKNISRVILVLSGKFDGVRKDLQKEMHTLSDEENFEKAKLIREQIAGLDYITSPQIPTDFYVENPNLYEDIRKKELAELKSLLKRGHLVINKLNRIECYDIAHLSGTNATASMVTFTNGEADKNYYRHFKIRQEKGGSDTDSLKEVAKRRFKHLQDWGVPDLMIVDGGEGQVNAFKKEIRNIPIVGVAKHPDRLIVMDIKMKLESLSLNLVSRMRDEAHRFARRYHHNLISKIYKNEIAV